MLDARNNKKLNLGRYLNFTTLNKNPYFTYAEIYNRSSGDRTPLSNGVITVPDLTQYPL